LTYSGNWNSKTVSCPLHQVSSKLDSSMHWALCSNGRWLTTAARSVSCLYIDFGCIPISPHTPEISAHGVDCCAYAQSQRYLLQVRRYLVAVPKVLSWTPSSLDQRISYNNLNMVVRKRIWRTYVPCTPLPSKPCTPSPQNQVPCTPYPQNHVLCTPSSKPCTVYPKLETIYPVPSTPCISIRNLTWKWNSPSMFEN